MYTKHNFALMLKTEILEGARGLYMRYGIKSVTMDDVARELGISKKTLYQHVDNKEDLIKNIIQQHIAEEKECMADITTEARDPIEQILMIARYVLQVLRSVQPTTMFDLKKYYREIWQMMDQFHQEHVYRMIRANLEEGVQQGLYRDDLDPDIIAKLYVGKTMLLTDDEFFPLREYDRDRLFSEYIIYHLRGIVSDEGLQKLKTYQPTYS